MRTMRKLSDEKTVRLFVPVPESMRDDFKRAVGSRQMSDVLREQIAAIIASAKPKRRRPARQQEDA